MQDKTFKVTNYMMASIETRIVNCIIDYILRIIIAVVIAFVIDVLFFGDSLFSIADWVAQMNQAEEFLLGMLLMFIYYTVTETLWGRSLAKFITGTMVVNEDGSKADIQTILIRSANRLIPFEFLTFLQNGARGWHDSNSKTYVVRTNRFYAGKKTFEMERQLDAEEAHQLLAAKLDSSILPQDNPDTQHPIPNT